MELRCRNHLHGIIDDDTIDFACKSRWCGKQNGVVVIHRFDVKTGELISTRRFAEPKTGGKSGTSSQPDAVRSA